MKVNTHFKPVWPFGMTRTCRFNKIVSRNQTTSIQHSKPNSAIIHSEWLTHQHRDTLASIVGHPTLTSYLAIADGESIGRIKFEMTEVCNISSRFSFWCWSGFHPFVADAPALWSSSTEGWRLTWRVRASTWQTWVLLVHSCLWNKELSQWPIYSFRCRKQYIYIYDFMLK